MKLILTYAALLLQSWKNCGAGIVLEKVALGVETLQECSTESTLRIFLAQKLPAVQKRFWRIFEVNLL